MALYIMTIIICDLRVLTTGFVVLFKVQWGAPRLQYPPALHHLTRVSQEVANMHFLQRKNLG